MLLIRPMTRTDLPLGMRLKTQAGWNQLEADWLRLLDLQPDGVFVAELDGTPAGTAATCTFGPVAWVAMVLVEAGLRGRGLGRALMERALDFLDRGGARTVRLDATPLGQPLYAKLGFLPEYTLTRWEGTAPGAEAPPGVRAVSAGHLQGLLRLDREVTRTDRGRLLLRLVEEYPDAARVVESPDGVEGYLLTRPGARARYLGPCVARGGAGALLLADAWGRHAGEPIFLDIPDGNAPAQSVARAAGLTPQRPLTRMYRGVKLDERVEDLWASSGPETG
jgi:GNAT superfamily N-acetyltransferase